MRPQKHAHHRFFVLVAQVALVCVPATSVSAFEINIERPGDREFVRVLADAGQRLGAVLPRAEDDANELADALITFD